MPPARFVLAALTVAVGVQLLTACASPPPPGPPGRHLVYRDAAGKVTRQFDYPTADFCRRVQTAAGRSARCQPEEAAAGLTARATLRYNPPGVLVEAHYASLDRCKAETGALAPGVQLMSNCTSTPP